ncbi:hypothetical protein [Enterococcus faecium]|uniref:Conjugal transfer protein-like C-terminal domain-containing protein n=1 Tax=Enterococcus faecium TaxID=1352 RepID=A0A242BDS9_ENTFC|nr:hypothetical protein [Enterococcus faecium]OTN93637.1 hypothetical protein A5810_001513 [Enterococcus faecium]
MKMITKKPSKYVFSETDIDEFVQSPEVYLYFEDFVTLIIDTNARLLRIYDYDQVSVVISKYTKDNQVILTEKLTLPVSAETNFEDLLVAFNRGKPQKMKQERIKTTKIKNKSKQTKNRGKRRVWLFIVLGVFVGLFGFQQFQLATFRMENQTLEREISDIQKLLSRDREIDTFSRFFLSSYFSKEKQNQAVYQEKLRKFVEIDTAKWAVPEGRLEGTYELGITYEKKQKINVSYMIALSNEQGQIETKKITFFLSMKKEKLRVCSEPQMITFSITE